jgi:hypothetical protein
MMCRGTANERKRRFDGWSFNRITLFILIARLRAGILVAGCCTLYVTFVRLR